MSYTVGSHDYFYLYDPVMTAGLSQDGAPKEEYLEAETCRYGDGRIVEGSPTVPYHLCDSLGGTAQEMCEKNLRTLTNWYKRTHREWPTCPYGGEIVPYLHSKHNDQQNYHAVLGLTCRRCEEL